MRILFRFLRAEKEARQEIDGGAELADQLCRTNSLGFCLDFNKTFFEPNRTPAL